MKTVLYIWAIVQALLIISGWAILLIDKKNGKKRKLGYMLSAIGSLMLAAFFIYLWVVK